jgi:hypothetical protein
LRTGRLGYYAASGVLLGGALHMYYISRLVPFVLLAVLVHLVLTERLRLVRSIRAGVVVFALGVLLAALPVGLFALQRPDIYSGRTNDVSIFKPENNGGNLSNAIIANVKTHMLMFDWQGDGNGRHNLPHTPMLDWLTAALFFGGLVSCAFRAWRWQYFFPIVWFAAALAGGVLTLPGEAPQSHRTLENSVVTALFAGIFLGQAWQVVTRRILDFGFWILDLPRTRNKSKIQNPKSKIQKVAAVASIAGILVAVGLAGEMNYTKYFVVQAQNEVVWKEMGTASSFAAHITTRYGHDHDVYVVPVYKNFPPSEFLAPDIETLTWPGTDAIPLTSTRSAGAVIILDPSSAADISAFARVYPHANFEIQTAPNSSEPIAYAVIVPASDSQMAHGVLAGIDGGDPDRPGTTDTTSILTEFSYDWAKSGAASGRLHLTSTLRVDTYGSYDFEWRNDGAPSAPADLLIDGYGITAKQPVTLSRGLHTLTLSADIRGQTGVSRLLWSQPGPPGPPDQPQGPAPAGEMTAVPASNLFDPRLVTPHGLSAAFRPGESFDGPPTLERIDSVVSFYFQETPLPRPYTGEWSGRIYIPQAGDYRFGTEQVSTSELSIDGQTIIANDAAGHYQEQNLPLEAGWHDIRLRYKDQDNYSNVFLYWTPPDRGKSIIPSSFLWPLMAHYPDKLEGRDAPTLDQSDGSSLPPDRITWFPPRPGP